jgi:hypothetical protein
MSRFLWTLPLISLLGCTVSGSSPDGSWLAGEWVMMDGILTHPLACGSHGPITYEADGRYALWGEAGTWRLKGNQLTETMADFDALHSDRSAADIGKPFVSTVNWIDRNRFSKRFADGSVNEFHRCPGTH